MDRFRAELSPDGTVLNTPGIDWGRPLKVVHSKGPCHVVRRAGHMTWAGRGCAQTYEETTYMLVRLETDKASTKTFAQVLVRANPGRRWRDCLKGLIEQCNKAGK